MGCSDRDPDYPRTLEDSPSDREHRGGGYAGRTFGARQNGIGYNRGYAAGAPTTVTRTPEAAATAAWSPEDG